MNTLTALKRCSLGLDLYLWLAYRTFALKRPIRLSWRQVYRQFGVDPDKASDKQAVKLFRRRILRELKKIKIACPGLKLRDRSGRLDPASLNTGHPSVTRAATPRGVAIPCPSAARRRPFCVGLDLGGGPTPLLNRQRQ